MTKLVKWNSDLFFPTLFPTTVFDDLERVFNGLYDYAAVEDAIDRKWKLRKDFPKASVVEQQDRAVIQLALAGYSKEQLNVQVEDNKLTVAAVKSEDKDIPTTLARRAFSESFLFNEDYDLENATVQFKDGMLTIIVNKLPPPPTRSKKLEIQ